VPCRCAQFLAAPGGARVRSRCAPGVVRSRRAHSFGCGAGAGGWGGGLTGAGVGLRGAVRVSEQVARSAWPGALAAGTALVVGAWLLNDGEGLGLPPAPTVAQAYDGSPVGPAVPPLPPSPPTRIRIASLGVDAPVTGLALDGGGRLQPPPDAERNLAGWYRDGAAPGSKGAAIMAGHVDNADGPAVFYRLGTLRRGDQLEVARADRSTVWFTVDGVETYRKKDFPDGRVYASTPDAQLRLITCGGGFSRTAGYDGNVVVYAHLVRAVRG